MPKSAEKLREGAARPQDVLAARRYSQRERMRSNLEVDEGWCGGDATMLSIRECTLRRLAPQRTRLA